MQRVLYILLLFSFSLHLAGQNPHPYFRNFTPDDGLPSPEVHDALQDHQGYMWFATDNGLSRFDGYSFKNFGPGEGLKNPVVFYLELDPEGRVWAATMHGALYYVENDSVYAFVGNDQIAKHNLKTNFITGFLIDKNNNKYLTIYNAGIISCSDSNIFEVLRPRRYDVNRLGIQVGDRWLSGHTGKNDSLDGIYSGAKNKYRPGSITELQDDSVYYLPAIDLDSSYKTGSSLWLKSLEGEYLIKFLRYTFHLYKGGVLEWTRRFGSSVGLKATILEADGSWLMGFQRGGGIRFYENVDKIRTGDFDQFLSGVSVSAIARDRKGGYWICSLEHGVYYCPSLQLKMYDKSCGFPMDHVVALDFKSPNELFVGFRDGNLIQFNTTNNQSLPFSKSKNNILYDLVWEADRSTLWMTDGSLNSWDSDHWETISTGYPGFIKNAFISKKLSWSKNRDKLWGAHYRGFAAVDLTSKSFGFISQTHNVNQRCFRVWEDQKGQVWAATVNGLFKLRDSIMVRPKPFDSLLASRIEDIAELDNGNLALATKGLGVLLWNGTQVKQITVLDGLTSDIIENIHVDNKGNIWAGTHLGLNKIILDDLGVNIQTYTLANGLPSNEITLIKSYEDQLWIGTNKGLVRWQDQTEASPSLPPVLEKVLINNKPIDPSAVSKLNHWQNNIQFHFLSINYKLNGDIPYRFRMNGGYWNNTSNRSVNFAALSPGEYTFEVQAQDEYGRWSEATGRIFTIQPPFWQSAWFTASWILLLLIIGWWIFRNRIEQVRQEARIEREMNELRSSALRAQMNPHFIFNCLNSIQNFIAKNDKENAARHLARFAQLVRRALNASTERAIALEEEIALLEDYLTLEQLRFKNKFDFSVEVDDQLHLFETEIPPMIIQPFVENAILHGMRDKRSKGKITVRFIKQNDCLVIEIEDNGPGIYHTGKNEPSAEAHRSMGIRIPKDRLRLANVNNRLKVTEIKDENGNSCGTLVRLTLFPSSA